MPYRMRPVKVADARLPLKHSIPWNSMVEQGYCRAPRAIPSTLGLVTRDKSMTPNSAGSGRPFWEYRPTGAAPAGIRCSRSRMRNCHPVQLLRDALQSAAACSRGRASGTVGKRECVNSNRVSVRLAVEDFLDGLPRGSPHITVRTRKLRLGISRRTAMVG